MGRWTRHPGRRLLLAAGFVLVLLEVPGAVELLRRPDPQIQLRHLTVMDATPGGPGAVAGLRSGDVLVSVDGVDVHSRADYSAALHRQATGTSTWIVQRGEDLLELEVGLPRTSTSASLRDLVPTLSGICFLFLGFITYLRRDDELGQGFHVCCLCFAASLGALPGTETVLLARLAAGLQDVAVLLLPLYLLRFVLLFPEGTPPGERPHPLLRWVLWPAAVLAPAHLLSALFPAHPLSVVLFDPLLLVTALLFAAALATALVVFLRKARGTRDWAQGSRMRLAAIGVALGFGPLLVVTVVKQFAPDRFLVLEDLALLALPLVPASFSMALLRSGSIDLAYLLRQALAATFIVLGVGTAAIFVVGVGKPLLPEQLRVTAYLVLLALVPITAIFAHLPVRWIDRVLYPEQARVRATSSALGQAIAREREPDRVVDLFLSGASELAEADSVGFYRPGNHGWVLSAGAGGFSTELPYESVLGREISRGVEMIRCREIEPSLDEAGRRWLEQGDIRVAGQLLVHGDPIGLVCLGPRRHGRAYGPLQLFHLGSLARQAAHALESALLHQADLQRERVRTELELAAQIQRRLLPEEDLEAGCLEVSGRTRSCREVGGDLYDHFHLSDGRIVVAVSDAVGKGIPASLLTSGLRTAVRETIRPGLDLGEAISSINRQVHGMTSPGHFIALFAAVLDPGDGIMEYCVAGAEPALWFRANGHHEWLNRGGPVLGVQPEARYPCGIVRLSPGDLVIPYSDGVIDEEDAEEEPFGRHGLLEAVTSCPTCTSAEIRDHILSRIQAHASAEEAVDDTTLVVIRRLRSAAAGTLDAAERVNARDRGRGSSVAGAGPFSLTAKEVP
jgi:sigma-B regulation protein RsbU (phosphoserine phosphatase)